MKIYIDSEYRCFAADDGTRREIETENFDGKCQTYLEGFRFIPAGESWVRDDGVVFTGEMAVPAVDYRILEAAQHEYEHQQYLDAMSALEAIYGGDTE